MSTTTAHNHKPARMGKLKVAHRKHDIRGLSRDKGILEVIRTGVMPPDGDAIAYRDGLPVSEFCAFAKQLGLPEATLAAALGFSAATVTRRKADNTPLTPTESDALIGAARIFNKASRFFDGDEASASRWMLRPCPSFGARTPMDCVRFGEKRARVLDFLDAGIHGVAFA